MNILIAPDSFKDSLSAVEVCDAVEAGILNVFPQSQIKKIPLADGGEGTVDALVHATNGSKIQVPVHDPLFRQTTATYGILGDGKTAVIEMAAASGIELLKEDERNPWETTTLGTGELIKNALDKGCRRFIIGIGGSATNDGGTGMAVALGANLYDDQKNLLKGTGGTLHEIKNIDLASLDKRIRESEILVACDVNNPLYGTDGAAVVYGPQKGANPNMVENLDKNLRHLGMLFKDQLNQDVADTPGAGAAGGLGAGLKAILRAELKPGFDIINETLNLQAEVTWADIVITGEGKIDRQTKFGKTPHGVAMVAKTTNKPVIAIAGTLGDGYEELYDHHFHAIFSIIDKPMNLSEALKNAPKLIQNNIKAIMSLFEQGRMLQKKS
jgi:glycerate kinase